MITPTAAQSRNIDLSGHQVDVNEDLDIKDEDPKREK